MYYKKPTPRSEMFHTRPRLALSSRPKAPTTPPIRLEDIAEILRNPDSGLMARTDAADLAMATIDTTIASIKTSLITMQNLVQTAQTVADTAKIAAIAAQAAATTAQKTIDDFKPLVPLRTEVPLLNSSGTDFADPTLKELLRGEQGPQGPQGLQGLQGLKGEQGPQGLQGIQGIAAGMWQLISYSEMMRNPQWKSTTSGAYDMAKVINDKGTFIDWQYPNTGLDFSNIPNNVVIHLRSDYDQTCVTSLTARFTKNSTGTPTNGTQLNIPLGYEFTFEKFSLQLGTAPNYSCTQAILVKQVRNLICRI